MVAEEPWGARLRRLREARGLSRTELAAACTRLGRRTEASDIIHYERDDYWPRVPTFAALARALGVPMEMLFYGEAEAARIARERRRAGRVHPHG
jgi:transcriptional regulator with XRE-family HTH domain